MFCFPIGGVLLALSSKVGERGFFGLFCFFGGLVYFFLGAVFVFLWGFFVTIYIFYGGVFFKP